MSHEGALPLERETPVRNTEQENTITTSRATSAGQSVVVYSRYEHGDLPVQIVPAGPGGRVKYLVSYPGEREPRVFKSARAMLSAFFGHDTHMSADQYFKMGAWAHKPTQTPTDTTSPSILDFFAVGIAADPQPSSDRAGYGPDRAGSGKYLQGPVDRSVDISGEARNRSGFSGPAEKISVDSERSSASVDKSSRVWVHGGGVGGLRKTGIAYGQEESGVGAEKAEKAGKTQNTKAQVTEFFEAMEAGMGPKPWDQTQETAYLKTLALELDKLEGFDVVGIDLEKRGHEVRKLLFAGFAGKMLSRGYDPEDVLQEIFRGLLVRNKGTCPWDRRKSSFGHYVHMVISCVLTNYHRKDVKRIDLNALPLEGPVPGGDEGEELPMNWGAVPIHYGSECGDEEVLGDLGTYLAQVPDSSPEAVMGRAILPLVSAGSSRREIVEATGYKEGGVSKAMAWVRRQTALWATELGIGRGVPAKYRTPPMKPSSNLEEDAGE